MDKREDRIKAVNTIINEIANRGRRFFFNKETNDISYFLLKGDKRKRLWFLDKRGGLVNPYPSNVYRDYNFSEGGTFWGLVHDFSEFILTGEYTNGNNGYGGLYCPHWGYSKEDMEAIRKIALDVGFLRSN